MDNNNNIEQLDSLFKQSFEGVSTNVPPGVWEGVASATTGASAAATGVGALAKLAGIKGAAIIGGAAVLVGSIYYINKSPKAQDEGLTGTIVEQVDSTEVKQDEIAIADEFPTKQVDELAFEERINQTEIENDLTDSEVVKNNNTSNSYDVNDVDEALNGAPINSIESKENFNNTNNNKDGVQNATVLVTIESNTQIGCINQPIDFSLKSNTRLASATWLLNGKVVSSNVNFARLMFETESTNVIEVTGNSHKGDKFRVTKTIEISKANARFSVKEKDGEVIATANSVGSGHMWFVDQVMIAEGKSTITHKTSNGQVRISHVIEDRNGCKDSVSELVELTKSVDCDFYEMVSNVITPYTQDGLNDEFVLPLPLVNEYSLVIYNPMNGNIVFDTKSQDVNWNGKMNNVGPLVPMGMYIYRLVYTCNGTSTKKQGKIQVTDQEN